MAELVLRKDAKRMLIRLLRSQGYATYAKLLEMFDVYLTDDPNTIGYMVPGEALIVLNKRLNRNQVSVIIRHEILHEYLKHAARKAAWLDKNPNYREIDDHNLTNIAADFEISNRAYTDADKSQIRAIIMNDEILSGLVTEDQFPGWENMTFEEMLHKLFEKRKKDYESLKPLIDLISKLNDRSLEDIRKQGEQAQQNIDDAQSQAGQGGEPQEGEGGEGSEKGESEDSKGGPGDETYPGQPTNGGSTSDDGHDQMEKDLADMEKENDRARKELDKIQKQSEKGGSSDKGEPFDSEAEQKAKADKARRVQEIEETFRDNSVKAQLIKEAEGPVRREKADKAAKAEAEYRKDPLRNFKLSLNSFIKNQLGLSREDTWSRINPSYEDSEFLLPGVDKIEKYTKPIINVYHDVSGSFSSEEKTRTAMSAIASLNDYKRKGKIDIKYYFFAGDVSASKSEAASSWGTNGEPIMQHIAKTKPTNVIIITDSDIDDCVSTSVVPGAVWLLFYGSTSQNLIDHIRGKKQTKMFLIGGNNGG